MEGPRMGSPDKQKQSLYFPDEMLREIMQESIRLDRSLSWTVQQAWRLARAELLKVPAARFPSEAKPERRATPVPRERGDGTAARDEREPSSQVREFIRGKFDCDPSQPRG